MASPDILNAWAAFVRLLRGRGYNLEDATVGLTTYVISTQENLRDCPRINEVTDSLARVALEERSARPLGS